MSGNATSRELSWAQNPVKVKGKMEFDLILVGEIQHSVRPLAGLQGDGQLILRMGEVPNLEPKTNPEISLSYR